VEYLTLDDVLQIAARVLDGDVRILMPIGLESAVARPQATFEGKDLHPSIHHKAAALMDSLANNHGLQDGNKRLALASVIVFYALNGLRLNFNNDDAYEFTLAVAIGLRDVDAIARVLAVATIFSAPWQYRHSRQT
jgi:death-on-curing protein